MEEDKLDDKLEIIQKISNQKDKTISDLRSRIYEFEDQIQALLEDQDKLTRLYEMGIIDGNGEYIPTKENENDEM